MTFDARELDDAINEYVHEAIDYADAGVDYFWLDILHQLPLDLEDFGLVQYVDGGRECQCSMDDLTQSRSIRVWRVIAVDDRTFMKNIVYNYNVSVGGTTIIEPLIEVEAVEITNFTWERKLDY